MTDYRYYTIPMLPSVGTQAVVDLEAASVSMDRQLGGAGNFQGTLRFTGNQYDLAMLNGTVPGYYALVCKRDGVVIWAGPIWSRSYEAQGQTVQITAQTYESIFQRIPLTSNLSYVATDPITVFNGFLTALSTQLSGTTDFGLTYASPPYSGGSPTITIQSLAADQPMADQFLDEVMDTQMLGYWMVNYGSGSGDAITKTLTWTSPFFPGGLTTLQDSGLSLEFPGTVSAYWLPENAAQGGVRHVAISHGGAGIATSNMATTLWAALGYPGSGWPAWTNIKQWPMLDPARAAAYGINFQTILDNLAIWQSGVLKLPRLAPTFELVNYPSFDAWNKLGYSFDMQITDRRFSTPFLLDNAVLGGWSLDPGSSETPEKIRLTVVTE